MSGQGRGVWLGAGLVALAALGAAVALLVGGKEPPRTATPSRFPTAHAVHGLDVSHHNRVRDWGQVAASGVQFVYVKATEGGDVRDVDFARHQEGARAAGLKVGAYHFFTFCRPAEDQVANFLGVAKGQPGDLPPAVDVEFVGNCRQPPSREVVRARLDAFLAAVAQATGRRPVLYATPESAAEYLVGLPNSRWLRSLGHGAPDGDWALWQFDPAGTVPGIEGPVDLDVFHGSRAALEEL